GKFTLLAISQSSFTIPGPGANIKFKDGEGEVNELDFQINERQMHGERIKNIPLTKENTIDYTGNFKSDELGVIFTLAFKNGRLLASNNRTNDIELTLIEPDVFSGDIWFMGLVKFKRNGDKAVTGFNVSTERMNDVKFSKIAAF
ncbi:hypothetical protein, partial [Flavitalea sp.]|nr:hypothetical protein [Flavitalea sp.]